VDINRIQFLREILVADGNGKRMSTMEFSYDSGDERAPHFFGVPDDDIPETRALYSAWGGNRPEGYQIGTTVRSPWSPVIPLKSIWKKL
jgi:hypothetical protein